MAKKIDKEFFELDLYETLGLSITANENSIKKAYRKKALSCHPDKNPDNPEAAEEFNRLKKILEVLLDPGARTAYDKVLKGRKAAELRNREANAKTRELKTKLEQREKAARNLQKVNIQISEEEKLRREFKRLEEEGQKIIQEELERVNRLAREELHQNFNKKKSDHPETHRVKAVWHPTKEWNGYTEEDIHRLFYKWGEINAIVMMQKEKKGTALIDFKEANGADMAVQFEKGMIGNPLEVSHFTLSSSKEKSSKKKDVISSTAKSSRDFESLAAMNQRRCHERRKLIEDMMKEENV